MTKHPYTLTLTSDEIKAIRFVASRGYATQVAALIDECDSPRGPIGSGLTLFHVPEHVAWEIASEEENNGGHGFGPLNEALTSKLYALLSQVV